MDVFTTPKTNYVQSWRHQISLIYSRSNPEPFLVNSSLENPTLSGISSFGKGGGQHKPEDPSTSSKFLRICVIFESLILWNCEILEIWNCEVWKLGNFETINFHERNPPTPQHSDSNPCTSPPPGGHEWFWGTRVLVPCCRAPALVAEPEKIQFGLGGGGAGPFLTII